MKSEFLLRNIAVLLLMAALTATAFGQKPGSVVPRQEKLLNGLKVLIWNQPAAEKVSVKIRIHGGSAFDPQGKEGVMKLLAEAMFPTQDSRDFFAEELGGSLEIVSNYDYVQVNATARNDQFLPLLETLATAIANPTIDKEVTAAVKTSVLAKVAELEKDPAYVADRAVAKRLLGTFPYGRPQMGTPESLATIDFADLLFAKERLFSSDNATVAISGNVNGDLAYRAARRYFGAWLKSDKKIPSTFKIPDPPAAALETVNLPVQGVCEIRVAARGLARSDKDFAASAILSSILANRLRTRVKAGDAFVRSEGHILPGVLVFGVKNFKNEQTDASRPKVEPGEILSKLIGERIADAEFNAAKAEVAGRASQTDLAEMWLDADTYKIAPAKSIQDSVAAVTIADAQRLADRYKTEPMASVMVTGLTSAN